MVTRQRAGQPRNWSSIPDGAKRFSVCVFSGSRIGVAEDSVFPGYVATSLCNRFATFRDSEATLSSKVKMSSLGHF